MDRACRSPAWGARRVRSSAAPDPVRCPRRGRRRAFGRARTGRAPGDGGRARARFWRGPGGGTSTTTYQFDAPFTIVSGLVAATVTNANTRLTLPSTSFHDGILRFQGPIASLSVDVDTTAAAEQAMTFAVVPESGLAASVAMGVAALGCFSRRRGWIAGREQRARRDDP